MTSTMTTLYQSYYAFIFVTFCVASVHSVIMPPRFTSSRPDQPVSTSNLQSGSNNSTILGYHTTMIGDDDPGDDSPYLLSINEGDSIDVKARSQSLITINLNRAIPYYVNVTVKVYSGPGLISFDDNIKPNNNSITHPTNVTIIYPANSFGDRVVVFHTTDAVGHAEIVCKITEQPQGIFIDDSSAYISINIGRSWELGIIIAIVGWLYFIAWSMSFYFQVILNYRRKSVVGLNFDFLALNLLGFTCYSIFNLTLMFSREVQKDYYERNTYSRIPVEYNDLFFALHAFLLTLITVIQCFIYERGEQKVSIPAGFFIGITSFVGVGLYITHLFHKIAILDVVLYLSYVKLAVTITKYTPQAYMNYQRKATTGWSIHNILLDFIGGVLSLAQMFLLAYNYDDWISIFGNFTKFGLGVISIAFDIIFVLQHYVLYRQIGHFESSTESIPSPVISQTIRSTSYRQQPSEQQDHEQDQSQPTDQSS